MSRKVSDKYCVPLCRLHHRELHRGGEERKWWRRYGIKPLGVASGLWEQSHAGEIFDSAAEKLNGVMNEAKFKGDGSQPSGTSDQTTPKVEQGVR